MRRGSKQSFSSLVMEPLDAILCSGQTLTREHGACTSYLIRRSIMERQRARLATHLPLQASPVILCQYKELLQFVCLGLFSNTCLQGLNPQKLSDTDKQGKSHRMDFHYQWKWKKSSSTHINSNKTGQHIPRQPCHLRKAAHRMNLLLQPFFPTIAKQKLIYYDGI